MLLPALRMTLIESRAGSRDNVSGVEFHVELEVELIAELISS